MVNESAPSTVETAKRQLNLLTHRIHTLPVLVLMPHSRCNCRCVMCDIWRANASGQELTSDDLQRQVDSIARLNVRRIVLSGGEALMHRNLWSLCELLKRRPVQITLLSTGLLLERHASDVVQWCDDVIVSLDGSRKIHDSIRNVPRAFDRLAAGVLSIKMASPAMRVTARCVLQRRNFADLGNIIDAAHDLGLDQISFLAADVSSQAFNRPEPWDAERSSDVALSEAEVTTFAQVVEQTIEGKASDFSTGFVAESPDKLRRLPRYYGAILGKGDFPINRCNAPWVSAVVEADGEVRPCFFHPAFGNMHQASLDAILNGPEAIHFRQHLDVPSDPTCRRCVCTLHVGPRAAV